MIFTLAPNFKTNLKDKNQGRIKQASYTLPSRINIFNNEQTSSGIFLVKLTNSFPHINSRATALPTKQMTGVYT